MKCFSVLRRRVSCSALCALPFAKSSVVSDKPMSSFLVVPTVFRPTRVLLDNAHTESDALDSVITGGFEGKHAMIKLLRQRTNAFAEQEGRRPRLLLVSSKFYNNTEREKQQQEQQQSDAKPTGNGDKEVEEDLGKVQFDNSLANILAIAGADVDMCPFYPSHHSGSSGVLSYGAFVCRNAIENDSHAVHFSCLLNSHAAAAQQDPVFEEHMRSVAQLQEELRKEGAEDIRVFISYFTTGGCDVDKGSEERIQELVKGSDGGVMASKSELKAEELFKTAEFVLENL